MTKTVIAKKVVAKKVPAKNVVAKVATSIKSRPEPMFSMPQEVKNWIDQASSRLAHLTSEVERLKEENRRLKVTVRSQEHRIMGTSQEKN
jgi:predicted RNase H-like nuclease (RuvC/YqgF family)